LQNIGFSVDNKPYIVPVNYGYADNTNFIHSAPEGKKIDLIKRNNNICFEIELDSYIIKDNVPCNWTTKYRSIIGYGKISIIADTSEKIKGLNLIMGKYGMAGGCQYQDEFLERIVILRIDIEDITAKQSGSW
jgi:nitroimidazol reductase NimA-like FMN-containing flavoprotein (pyridoxamine 5'-phosphate oxidase superfamily)